MKTNSDYELIKTYSKYEIKHSKNMLGIVNTNEGLLPLLINEKIYTFLKLFIKEDITKRIDVAITPFFQFILINLSYKTTQFELCFNPDYCKEWLSLLLQKKELGIAKTPTSTDLVITPMPPLTNLALILELTNVIPHKNLSFLKVMKKGNYCPYCGNKLPSKIRSLLPSFVEENKALIEMVCNKCHLISLGEGTIEKEEKDEVTPDFQILPKVEPSTFMIENNQLYYKHEEKFYRIEKLGIYANGIKDSCVAFDGKLKSATIKKISETTNKEILFIPKGDILWASLESPIGKIQSIILEITPDIKKMLNDFFLLNKDLKAQKPKDFDMYYGDKYEMYRN